MSSLHITKYKIISTSSSCHWYVFLKSLYISAHQVTMATLFSHHDYNNYSILQTSSNAIWEHEREEGGTSPRLATPTRWRHVQRHQKRGHVAHDLMTYS